MSQALQQELEAERGRALRMEARVEEQLAEFDTEREQLRSRLKKEEAHCCLLQREVRNRRSPCHRCWCVHYAVSHYSECCCADHPHG